MLIFYYFYSRLDVSDLDHCIGCSKNSYTQFLLGGSLVPTAEVRNGRMPIWAFTWWPQPQALVTVVTLPEKS